ncbi:MAG: YceI family protein [Gammaproteobacteria bacterium]|nr:YceI family protein [Gammaproteobacteria bacterium]
MRVPVILLLVALVLLQAGCHGVREPPQTTAEQPLTTQPVPAGYTRYRVVSDESEVRVLVYRDGPLARLGHNHVLSSSALQGDVLVGDKGQQPRVSLVLPVSSFSVDQAELRAEEGEDFPGAVDADAIIGTRKNMLSEPLLDAARFPDIRLTSQKAEGQAPDYTMTVTVEVKGQAHELQVPVRVEQGPKELRATGAFTVTHEELGLTPFTVMGGLLSVRDEIRLRFRIVARPAATNPGDGQS